MRVTIRVPASIANLGPGFDILALALQLQNEVVCETADGEPLSVDPGEGAPDELHDPQRNRVAVAYSRACSALGRRPGGVRIRCVNRIPMARGLGSSAAAALGGVLAATALHRAPWDSDAVLDVVQELEGHRDNAAAALLGGLAICAPGAPTVQMNVPEELRCVLFVPDHGLATEQARAVVPASFSRADAIFNVAEELKVKRVVATGGVYAQVPYDKDRHVSCSYSMKHMKAELDQYAVRFSNYEGGVSLGTYMADRAEYAGMEYVAFYAFVPMYDLSELSPQLEEALSVERDFKAWYDILRRINHMCALRLDLSDLQRQSNKLLQAMNRKVDDLERKQPQAGVRAFIDKLSEQFTEMSFVPLDDVWDRELGDLFDNLE